MQKHASFVSALTHQKNKTPLYTCSRTLLMGTRLFPWADWQEWDEVRSLLCDEATKAINGDNPSPQLSWVHRTEGVSRVSGSRRGLSCHKPLYNCCTSGMVTCSMIININC